MPSENERVATLATEKLRERNRRSGTSGYAVAASCRMNATISATPATSAPATGTDAQPRSPPRTIPQTPDSTPAPTRTKPIRSSGWRRP